MSPLVAARATKALLTPSKLSSNQSVPLLILRRRDWKLERRMLQPFALSLCRHFFVRHIRTPATQCRNLGRLDLCKTLPLITKQRILRLFKEQYRCSNDDHEMYAHKNRDAEKPQMGLRVKSGGEVDLRGLRRSLEARHLVVICHARQDCNHGRQSPCDRPAGGPESPEQRGKVVVGDDRVRSLGDLCRAQVRTFQINCQVLNAGR